MINGRSSGCPRQTRITRRYQVNTVATNRAAVSDADTRADARAYVLALPAEEIEALYAETGRHIPHAELPDGDRRTTVMVNRIVGRLRTD